MELYLFMIEYHTMNSKIGNNVFDLKLFALLIHLSEENI
jgi:hypothetical protein